MVPWPRITLGGLAFRCGRKILWPRWPFLHLASVRIDFSLSLPARNRSVGCLRGREGSSVDDAGRIFSGARTRQHAAFCGSNSFACLPRFVAVVAARGIRRGFLALASFPAPALACRCDHSPVSSSNRHRHDRLQPEQSSIDCRPPSKQLRGEKGLVALGPLLPALWRLHALPEFQYHPSLRKVRLFGDARIFSRALARLRSLAADHFDFCGADEGRDRVNGAGAHSK